MPTPRFTIGIDLGTTNCAMAFVALDAADASSEVFPIPQWESTDRLAESATLPSFLYLPTDAEAAQLQSASGKGWICGRFARTRAGEVPGRVAHSAKLQGNVQPLKWSIPFLTSGKHQAAVRNGCPGGRRGRR